ncbi:MAG: hypothetical protein Q4C56_06840 [Peptococcaceae bacterium]|nr:hypothetical protein [Peptococcaceae bacterium]
MTNEDFVRLLKYNFKGFKRTYGTIASNASAMLALKAYERTLRMVEEEVKNDAKK